MLHAPAPGNALLWSYVAAYAFKWDGITLLAPIATDREAAHVQVAVVQLFASEVPQRATLARIMAAMGLSREVLLGVTPPGFRMAALATCVNARTHPAAM